MTEPRTLSFPEPQQAIHAASRVHSSREANLVLELLELLELEMTSSGLGRTNPARFSRSRIIWPLMLMSSGELEWRLQAKDAEWSKQPSRSLALRPCHSPLSLAFLG